MLPEDQVHVQWEAVKITDLKHMRRYMKRANPSKIAPVGQGEGHIKGTVA
jgi:hypothetical protein